MRYHMMVATTGLLMLSACDDPKPAADSARPVSAPGELPGPSSQQGTVAKETPGETMMMQSGQASGNAQTMTQGSAMQNQPRPGPDGEPLAGTQPLQPAPQGTAPGDTAPRR